MTKTNDLTGKFISNTYQRQIQTDYLDFGDLNSDKYENHYKLYDGKGNDVFVSSNNITFDKPNGGGLIISKSERNVVLKGTNDYTGDVYIGGGFNESEQRKGIVYLGHATGSFEKDNYGNDLIENTSSVYVGVNNSLRVPDFKVYADRVSMTNLPIRLEPEYIKLGVPRLWDSIAYIIGGPGASELYPGSNLVNQMGTNRLNLLISEKNYDRIIILNFRGSQVYVDSDWVNLSVVQFHLVMTNTNDYLTDNQMYKNGGDGEYFNTSGGIKIGQIRTSPRKNNSSSDDGGLRDVEGVDCSSMTFILPSGYKILVGIGTSTRPIAGNRGGSSQNFYHIIEGFEQKLGL